MAGIVFRGRLSEVEPDHPLLTGEWQVTFVGNLSRTAPTETEEVKDEPARESNRRARRRRKK